MNDPRKPMFDAARREDADGVFTDEDVAKIAAALDAAGVPDSRTAPDPPSEAERSDGPLRVGLAGIALIKRFEGCARRRPDGRFAAYPDPGTGGEPWTIGWGATGQDGFGGGRIRAGTVWTQEQCDTRLDLDLRRYAEEVLRALGKAIRNTSQAEFDALVSFHYNTGAIARATLTRKHVAGDKAGAAREFERWSFAGGRVMKGLQRRRLAERALYEGRAA
ncbi:lysozyme [Aurantiacibacter luteus]|uniref:Lysozyme n=1 Tax=Aurantiacibacter luteus TaxID=1581420 RepID=A0A0G9MP20_9SPHN|nr:lysozyme [Aurantiacibacter luteus]KLE32466.1 hypothetical protein AAW00_13665 [Aurantiacibacter luteus]